ncbi:MAG: ABC transporter ATP-binding protein [Pseudomonadota bacterium]|nr:ABC transporter ATP-binding protein [Pseudomonadota bacterium]
MALCQLLHSVMLALTPFALSGIVRSAQGGPQSTSMSHAVALFALFALLEIAAGRGAGALQLRLAPIQRQAALRTLYAWLQGHSYRYLHANFAGALAHRIGETALSVNQILWSLLFDISPVVVTLILSTALLLRAHSALGLLVGAWSAAFLATSFLLARTSQPFALAAAAARAETTGTLVDSVTHLSSARIFARMAHERAVLDEALARELRTIRVANRYTERIRWNQAAAFALLKLGSLFYALTLWRAGQLPLADLVLTLTLGIVIINESVSLGRRFLELFEYLGNLNNGVRTLLVPHEITDPALPAPLQVSAGRISFDAVSFAYPGGAPVFDRLSVEIPGGQRVGLVGYSGSGKSSFVNLLLRLYDVDAGAVRIDGQDVRRVAQDELHASIGLIPQDPGLFHRSLRDNIRYGRLDASEDAVREAARQARADGFIAQIAQGYEALVGERGVKLSGGQRQRVAIARALLKDAPILVLDEATSSLDSITERTIQETLGGSTQGKTVIVIAHRLSTVAHLDRLLVFEAGRLVQDGSHAELIARPGLYQRLWQMQADGFLGGSTDAAGHHDGAAAPDPARIEEAEGDDKVPAT